MWGFGCTVARCTGSSSRSPSSPSSAVTIIVEPDGEDAQQLVTAIEGATTSVYMTMYELDNTSIIDALATRATAHLDVEVILDGGVGSGVNNRSVNAPAYTKLTAAGANVVWSSPAFTFTHEKCVIIDQSVAWIMTMDATAAAPTGNREYLAIDTAAADVAEATAIFKADHAMQSITPSGALVVAPTNARAALVALINSATTTLDVEDEGFSDTDPMGIVAAVEAAGNRGVAVHVVIGNTGPPDATSVALVKAGGAQVVVTGPTSGSGTMANPYIHGNAILVDCDGTTCKTGWIGSENMTADSLGSNRELGVIFDSQPDLAKIKAAVDTDFAAGSAQ